MNSRKLLIFKLPLLIVVGLLHPAHADETLLIPEPHDLFAASLHIDYENSQRRVFRTGQTVRKQLFMSIYAMAHYLEHAPLSDGDSVYQSILQSTGLKQISMVFLRGLRAEQIQQSLLSGIKSNTTELQFLTMQDDVAIFMNAIDQDVKADDEFVLRWYPDGKMDSFYQGSRISSISNSHFARAMWAIWFGDGSVVDRSALVQYVLPGS